ncbi:glycosyltransferase family 2 protein [Snuella lapsa]|uniref:Glycosyltransferase 2-like domain-containing protein n=1 Tax=Snuella lapsa TaxID=870481 RepID=A0ABP6XSA9_9FLAO
MALVSVIIPSYNSAHFISEAIDSILEQTYGEWELIVVDDGSTDALESVVRPYIAKDARISMVVKANGGLGSARNFGIRHAKGTYILPLDADDRFAPTFIEKAVAQFINRPDLKVVYCEAVYFGAKQGRWLLKDYSYKDLLVSNMIFASAMYKKADYERVGGYDEQILYEDWDYWLRLLQDGGTVCKLPEVLFYYRQHQDGSLMNALNKKGALHSAGLERIYAKNAASFIEVYGNPIEIELKRQKLQRSLAHPLHRWVEAHKDKIIGRLLLKLVR